MPCYEHLARLLFIKYLSTEQISGHFWHFLTMDAFEICRRRDGVMDTEISQF